MFKKQIEAVLKSAPISAKLDWRVAHCTFHVPLDRQLAKEVSPRVADRLYRLKNPTASNSEYVPCLEIRHIKFSEDDVKLSMQRMEFRVLPDNPIPGAVIPGAEILSVEAVSLRGARDLTLVLAVRFRFQIPHIPIMARLLIEQLGQTVWLTFTEQQQSLLSDEQDSGASINERKHRGPLVRFDRK